MMTAAELPTLVCPGAAGGGPRASRTAEHDLVDVLTIAMAAAVCGADSLAAAEPFGRAKQRWLGEFLRLRNGIPPAETFCGVFAALRPASLPGCLRGAAAQVGRYVRTNSPGPTGGPEDEPGGSTRVGTALPPVSVRTTPGGICLAQEAGGLAPNGRGSLADFLGVLDLVGAVVAIDAGDCGENLAPAVRGQAADCLLGLGRCRRRWCEAIERLQATVPGRRLAGRGSRAQGLGPGPAPELWSCDVLPVPGAVQGWGTWPDRVVVVRREGLDGFRSPWAKRYYLSGGETEAEQMLPVLQEHWRSADGIGGTFNLTVGRSGPGWGGPAPENFAVLHRLAVATLQRMNGGRGSVVGKRAVAASNNDFLERALVAFAA